MKPASSAWYPRPLDDEDGDDDDDDNDDDEPGSNEDEWEKVRAQWDATPVMGAGAAQQAVDLWAALSFTGWDTSTSASKSTSVSGGKTAVPGDITGAAPRNLLRQGVFEMFYTEAPRMVAVAVGG